MEQVIEKQIELMNTDKMRGEASKDAENAKKELEDFFVVSSRGTPQGVKLL